MAKMIRERQAQAIIALYDYSTRAKATSDGILTAMEKDGFSRSEIIRAIETMLRQDATP